MTDPAAPTLSDLPVWARGHVPRPQDAVTALLTELLAEVRGLRADLAERVLVERLSPWASK